MLVELCKGNFNIRADIDGEDDFPNTVLAGLNMLGEELTFYRSQLDIKTGLLEKILNNINEVVYTARITEPDIHTLRHEFISPRVYELIGYSDEEIFANPCLWYRSIHPDDTNAVNEAITKLFSSPEATCEYRIKPKESNEYIWLEDRMISRKSKDNTHIQVFCSARDITQKKQFIEEREQLIKELNDKYNKLMQFNYIVSHNLRAPVASIIGICELLAQEPDMKEAQEMHGYILHAANSLDTLLKDLNSILAAKSRLNERNETFLVSDILKDFYHLMAIQLEQSKATISIDIAENADIANSVKSYVQSCLYNLVSNAIKYQHHTLQLKIDIKVWLEDSKLFFRVEDNGIGIDLIKYKNEIFGIYKRFNFEHEGKGLGLHMTKVQIESLGGSIDVASEPGQGSVFTLTLPQ